MNDVVTFMVQVDPFRSHVRRQQQPHRRSPSAERLNRLHQMHIGARAVDGGENLVRLVFKLLAVIQLEGLGERRRQRILRVAILREDQHTGTARRSVPANVCQLLLEQLESSRVHQVQGRERLLQSLEVRQFGAVRILDRLTLPSAFDGAAARLGTRQKQLVEAVLNQRVILPLRGLIIRVHLVDDCLPQVGQHAVDGRVQSLIGGHLPVPSPPSSGERVRVRGLG